MDDKNSKFNINEDDYEYRLLRSFFDIYENKYQNNIVDKLAFKNLSAKVMINGEYRQVSEVITNNLPYDAPFAEEYYSNERKREKVYREDLSTKSNPTVNIIAAVFIARILFPGF